MSNPYLARIDEVITAFEAIQPSKPNTFRSALVMLRAVLGKMDGPLSIFLQQKFALFVDIDPNDPVPQLGISDQEVDAIVKAFWANMPILAMEQPDINLDDLATVSEEDVVGAKQFGLFMLFCLKLMLTIGVAGGSWYNIRQLSSRSAFTAEGQGAAIGSGVVGAVSQATMDAAFDQFTGWLQMSPTFKGENISTVVDMTRTFVTGLLGATTWFGVLQILSNVDNQTPYQLFGLFGLAFFFVGAINAAGEVMVGRQLAPLGITADQLQQMRPLLHRLYQRLADKKTGAQLLLNFLAWYSYWDYNEGFLQLAKTESHEQVVLWGSLCIFFQFAGFGAFGIEKIFSQHSSTNIEAA